MDKKPEYSFTKEVESKLKSFKTYLHELGNGENTIRQKSNYTGYFLMWLESEHLQVEDTRYNDLLNFVDHCRLEGKTRGHINAILRAIRYYYEFKKLENPAIINPARNLHLKGTRQKIISGVIPFEKLETLYQTYKAETPKAKRNKSILGLFVYQGITTEELHKLEPGHLKLKEGTIYIPGNRRRNNRILKLNPFQILELHEYITETRPKILDEITTPKPARKPDKINKMRIESQLFISVNGSENIKNSLWHLFREIKKTHPDITSAEQIRKSVIVNWLKTLNLREVQYMAGHKYVSSTERYQTNNLENLQKKLEMFHPLNRTF